MLVTPHTLIRCPVPREWKVMGQHLPNRATKGEYRPQSHHIEHHAFLSPDTEINAGDCSLVVGTDLLCSSPVNDPPRCIHRVWKPSQRISLDKIADTELYPDLSIPEDTSPQILNDWLQCGETLALSSHAGDRERHERIPYNMHLEKLAAQTEDVPGDESTR